MSYPVSQGIYLPAKRSGDLVFTSGMTPRLNGVLIAAGKVAAGQPPGTVEDAVVLAARNALMAARTQATEGEDVIGILSMTVFIAAEPHFAEHSKIADFASAYLKSELGDSGVGARAAVGVASLPADAMIEIALVALLGKNSEPAGPN